MPLPRVKFTHPKSGEKVRGHLRSVGMNGAAILDDEGQTHRIPHGEYVREDPPRASLLDAAAKHLPRGVDEPIALAAACALLDEGGVRSPEKLRWSDVRIDKDGSVLVIPDKVRVREPEALRKLLTDLLRGAGRGPLFVVDDRQITPHEVTEYVRQFAPKPEKPKMLAKAQMAGRAGLTLSEGASGARRWRRLQDKEGKDRVYYHGAAAKFDKFDSRYRGENTGYPGASRATFFSESPVEAGHYRDVSAERLTKEAEDQGEEPDIDPRIIKAHIGANNPMIIGMDADDSNVDPDEFDKLVDDDDYALKYAKQNGHDAVVWKHGNVSNAGHTVAVFDDDQIEQLGTHSMAKAVIPGMPHIPGMPRIPGATMTRPGYVLTVGPTGAKRWRKVTDARARQRGGVFALGAKHPLIIGASAAASSVPPDVFAELSGDAYKAIEYAHGHGHDAVVWMLSTPPPQPAALAKASARAMNIPQLGVPERSWSENGYRCSFRHQRPGLGMLTIEHEDMPLPLHEIVSDFGKARSKATEFVGALVRGETPQGGVYAAVGA